VVAQFAFEIAFHPPAADQVPEFPHNYPPSLKIRPGTKIPDWVAQPRVTTAGGVGRCRNCGPVRETGVEVPACPTCPAEWENGMNRSLASTSKVLAIIRPARVEGQGV